MIIKILKNDIAPTKSLTRDLLQLRNQHRALKQSTLFVLPDSPAAETSAIKDHCRYINDASVSSVLHTLQQNCTDTDYVYISNELISDKMIEELKKLEVTKFDSTAVQPLTTISPLRSMIIRQLRVLGDIPQSYPIRIDYIPTTDKTVEGLKIEFVNPAICYETVVLLQTLAEPSLVKRTTRYPNTLFVMGEENTRRFLDLLGLSKPQEMTDALRKEFHFAFYSEEDIQTLKGTPCSFHADYLNKLFLGAFFHTIIPNYKNSKNEIIQELSNVIENIIQSKQSLRDKLLDAQTSLAFYSSEVKKMSCEQHYRDIIKNLKKAEEKKKRLLAKLNPDGFILQFQQAASTHETDTDVKVDTENEDIFEPISEDEDSVDHDSQFESGQPLLSEPVDQIIPTINLLITKAQTNSVDTLTIEILHDLIAQIKSAIGLIEISLRTLEKQDRSPLLSEKLDYIHQGLSLLSLYNEIFLTQVNIITQQGLLQPLEEAKAKQKEAEAALNEARAALSSQASCQLETDLAFTKHLRRFYGNCLAQKIIINTIQLTQEGHLRLEFQLFEPKQQRKLFDAVYDRARLWNKQNADKKDDIKLEDVFVNCHELIDNKHPCSKLIINKKYFHRIFNLSMQDVEDLVAHTIEQWIQVKKSLSVTPSLLFHPDGTFNLTEADQTYTFGTREGMNPIDELNDYLALQKAQLPPKISNLAKRMIEPKLIEAIQLKTAQKHNPLKRLKS